MKPAVLAAWRDHLYESFTEGYSPEKPFRFKIPSGWSTKRGTRGAAKATVKSEDVATGDKRKSKDEPSKRKYKSRKVVLSSEDEEGPSQSSDGGASHQSYNPRHATEEPTTPARYNTRSIARETSSVTPSPSTSNQRKSTRLRATLTDASKPAKTGKTTLSVANEGEKMNYDNVYSNLIDINADKRDSVPAKGNKRAGASTAASKTALFGSMGKERGALPGSTSGQTRAETRKGRIVTLVFQTRAMAIQKTSLPSKWTKQSYNADEASDSNVCQDTHSASVVCRRATLLCWVSFTTAGFSKSHDGTA